MVVAHDVASVECCVNYFILHEDSIMGYFLPCLGGALHITIHHKKRTEFCYAGDWTYYIHFGTSEMTQCYCGKRVENIFDEFTPAAIGRVCTMAHCYNRHVWLAFGDIPQLRTPTYLNFETGLTRKEENG